MDGNTALLLWGLHFDNTRNWGFSFITFKSTPNNIFVLLVINEYPTFCRHVMATSYKLCLSLL
jgi:hypothetical protein